MNPTGNSIADLLSEPETRETVSGLMRLPLKDAFFGQRGPTTEIVTETPIHRGMVYMRARGATVTEIARLYEYSIPAVSNILRQPWAQERMAQEVTDAGRDQLSHLIETAAKDSLLKLISVRDDPETPKNVVSNNCQYLVDRFLGKPKQSIRQEMVGDPSKMTDQQLAEIAGTGLTQTITRPSEVQS